MPRALYALLAFLALPASGRAASAAAHEEARRIAFSLEIAAAEYAKAVSGASVDKVEQQEALEFLGQAAARFKRLAASESLDDFTRGPVEAELAALQAEARAAQGDPGAFRGKAARAAADVAEAFGASAALVPPRHVSKKAGAEVYRMHCAMCHGAKGDGRGPAYPGLNPKPARFDDASEMARKAPAQLFRVVAVGVEGTAMTGFDDRLTERQRWEAVYHLYSFTGHANAEAAAAVQGEDSGPGTGGPSDGPRGSGLGPVAASVKAELGRAVALAAAGDAAGAADAAADAYLRFEPAEPSARALDAAGTAALEGAFTALRAAARSGEKDLSARAADIGARLDALAAPRDARGAWATFAQSFLIIGREGFEAMLVLAAIAALLGRAGRKGLLATFYAGAWAGVAASLATAWALEALFSVTPVQREGLEGLVLVAAAATLLYVAYWMINAGAMGDWNRWLRERLGKATGEEGGAWALASVSFLAVYREGFETVLFYKALWSMDPSQSPAIAAGFAAGCAALAVLFLLMRRGTLRVPMRPFFLATGALLYWLAFTFVGRAPTVLQAAGWMSETPTPWSLSVPWAGVNPTWESAGPQLLVALLGLGGAAVLLSRSGPMRYNRSKMMKTAALLLLAASLPASSWAAAASLPVRPVTPRGPLDADEQSVVSLFKGATGSVVYITNIALARDAYWLNETEYPQGAGSGFLWDEDGHVVTNFHVISNADAAEVTLSDHSTWKAKFVGAAPDKDLAVLKIDAPKGKLKPIPLGTSKDLQVGQKVFAIGNPFGLDQTLTTGIISALGREIQSMTRRPISGVIQTDAAINPGNSGGPLLDSAGRLIGVNTAIYSPSGASSGVGFAVPADIVASIIPQLIKHGKVVRPGFGINIADDSILQRIGLVGVLIRDVAAGGAADQAGLLPTRRDRYGRIILGDVIVAVDGKETADSDALFRVLDAKAVGDTVKVSVLRDGRRREVTVRLQGL